MPFDTRPRFESVPREIRVENAKPHEPVVKRVSIFNNYRQYFEIGSGSSKHGFVKLLKVGGEDARYQVELEITPPQRKSDAASFSDVFTLFMKGGSKLEIPCSGSF